MGGFDIVIRAVPGRFKHVVLGSFNMVMRSAPQRFKRMKARGGVY